MTVLYTYKLKTMSTTAVFHHGVCVTCTLKDFKNAKKKTKIIIFCIQNSFCLLYQMNTDDSDTLRLSIPNSGVFKDPQSGYHQLFIAGLRTYATKYFPY